MRIALQVPDELLADNGHVYWLISRGLNSPRPRAVTAEPGLDGGDGRHGGGTTAANCCQSPTTTPSSPYFTSFAATPPSPSTPAAAERKVPILADTYAAHCVDEIAAEHVFVDALVHCGRACLSLTTRLLVVSVFAPWPPSAPPRHLPGPQRKGAADGRHHLRGPHTPTACRPGRARICPGVPHRRRARSRFAAAQPHAAALYGQRRQRDSCSSSGSARICLVTHVRGAAVAAADLGVARGRHPLLGPGHGHGALCGRVGVATAPLLLHRTPPKEGGRYLQQPGANGACQPPPTGVGGNHGRCGLARGAVSARETHVAESYQRFLPEPRAGGRCWPAARGPG